MSTSRIATQPGWPALFWEAFTQSKNAMLLLDDERRHVEVNGAYLQLLGYRRDELIGRPARELRATGSPLSVREWQDLLRKKHFQGTIDLACADGGRVTVQFAGHPEIVTGRQLILMVALHTARGGRRFRRDVSPPATRAQLSDREREVVWLIAAGMSGPEIAGELSLTHNTVRTHVRNAMDKLGSRSRAQLVAQALGEALYTHDSSAAARTA